MRNILSLWLPIGALQTLKRTHTVTFTVPGEARLTKRFDGVLHVPANAGSNLTYGAAED